MSTTADLRFPFLVNRDARLMLLGQKSFVIWLTGFSGSGKSTIANALETRLFSSNIHTYIIDGDQVRHGLNSDLGFTDADRFENIRRVAEVVKMFLDSGIIVIVSVISPYSMHREMARKIIGSDSFFEVFVDTPIETCIERDTKGLYWKDGNLNPAMPGIGIPYEKPEAPFITVSGTSTSVEDEVSRILSNLKSNFKP